jgi:hypothetical protein
LICISLIANGIELFLCSFWPFELFHLKGISSVHLPVYQLSYFLLLVFKF